ncbi:hypothetical protein Agabi119p4_11400 [Agaricus bisporus var. burnettii]|uniref:Uncharacterized protein n=1 Tax=Agaricus bisporus var. burnettii TaxID=192524 RepID=A0A8H7C031_AGABI|nr:hypothetical protein Agabi119p4_11400 [Agaricus bisporus var. burnettii]
MVSPGGLLGAREGRPLSLNHSLLTGRIQSFSSLVSHSFFTRLALKLRKDFSSIAVNPGLDRLNLDFGATAQSHQNIVCGLWLLTFL